MRENHNTLGREGDRDGWYACREFGIEDVKLVFSMGYTMMACGMEMSWDMLKDTWVRQRSLTNGCAHY